MNFRLFLLRRKYIKFIIVMAIGVETLGHETKIYLRSDGMSEETAIIIKQVFVRILEMLRMPLLQIHRSFAVNMKNVYVWQEEGLSVKMVYNSQSHVEVWNVYAGIYRGQSGCADDWNHSGISTLWSYYPYIQHSCMWFLSTVI